MAEVYLGLDLGGTNIKSGVVDAKGRILTKSSMPTGAESGPDTVIRNMVDAAERAVSDAGLKMTDIAGIGVGSPGPLNFETGTIIAAPNIPGFRNIPLRDRIHKATGRPVVLENDANAAAFGEFWAGAGRDPSVRHLIMLTLGTGIGTGIIIDGVLLHGAFGNGGEGGHIIVEPDGRLCGCGQRGCLETYASASRTALRAQEAVTAGEASSLKAVMAKKDGQVSAKDVFDAAQSGDALALRVVEESARELGLACVNFCRLFDPQMIVFAGGMALAGDYLLDMVRKVFDAQTWHIAKDRVVLSVAQLGNDAGLVGAAGVAWNATRKPVV